MNRTAFASGIDFRPLYTIGQASLELSGARPVRSQQIGLAQFIPPHNHDFTELVIVCCGAVAHYTSEGPTQVEAGSVLVVPPGESHAYGAARECQVINLYYLSEWFLWDLNLLWSEGLVPLFFASHLLRRSETRRVRHFCLSPDETASCERELNDIEREYLHPNPSLLFMRGAFFKILVILARAWRRQTPGGDLHFRREVWRALEAIDICIKEGGHFRVDKFARDVGLATGSFSRLFRASTGFSPTEYFGRRRTQHAAHLLIESNLSIGEIASHLGFCDAAHLSRAFHQNQNLSPRTFRVQYQRLGGSS